ncbi:MAG: SUMF1/EgtB/PvdO family nonheme iron enzyme [Planctomycetota bacterium]
MKTPGRLAEQPILLSGLLLGLLLGLLASGLACSEEEREPRARPDPRVAHLRHWVAFRRPGDGSLYFLDRFEAREQDWVEAAHRPEPGPDRVDLPKTRMTLLRSLELCRFFWGRLPRVDEWHFAVEGRRGWRFPWGDKMPSVLYANTLELGLHRPTRVGTFESGRGNDCYDLIGNVSEWTITPLLASRLDRARVMIFTASYQQDENEVFKKLLELRRLYLDHLRPRGSLFNTYFPWLYASPLLPELRLSGSGTPAELVPRLEFITLGFDFGHGLEESLDKNAPGQWPERLGVRGFEPTEYSSYLGLRMATDPYTFLATLERAPGRPESIDRELLRGFLNRHAREFRQAAALRGELDGTVLGLEAPGAWQQASQEILGVRW